ncbi:alpha-amylase [Emticicia sp. C21]|uniref:alpha-amylase n=1 Tax=Emticicia sp. C21 TaxID=2302915 RepID=UPI0021009E10|nr:alpha-amylase [Emticicia sp. C21]
MGNDKDNYDFLMLSDIEYRNREVREELKKWGKWYYETTHFDGIRLDALKHITPGWPVEWLDYMRQQVNPDLVAIGEYWTAEKVDMMEKYIEATEGRIKLFDAPLHYNFCRASNCDKDFDLRTIFDNTLVRTHPTLAVTFVDNHDTQPMQALESCVESWFKTIAYALILLRQDGYPCIFYADFYGVKYQDKGKDGTQCKVVLPQLKEIKKLLVLRKKYAYGEQTDYFDHENCIGWVRSGSEEGPGCIVLLTNCEKSEKRMEVGARYAGKSFVDFLHPNSEEVIIDEDGTGVFQVEAKSVSVWVLKEE